MGLGTGLPSYSVPPSTSYSSFGAGGPQSIEPSNPVDSRTGKPSSPGDSRTGEPSSRGDSRAAEPFSRGDSHHAEQPGPGAPRAAEPFGGGHPPADQRTQPFRAAGLPPFGVGEPGQGSRPFGGNSSAAPDSRQQPGTVYGNGGYTAADPTMPVPTSSRPAPTPPADATMPINASMAGIFGSIDQTMPVSMSAVENSGSLTGHILAQGWRDEVVDRRRSNIKVIVAMLVVVGLLVAGSLYFLASASDTLKGVLH